MLHRRRLLRPETNCDDLYVYSSQQPNTTTPSYYNYIIADCGMRDCQYLFCCWVGGEAVVVGLFVRRTAIECEINWNTISGLECSAEYVDVLYTWYNLGRCSTLDGSGRIALFTYTHSIADSSYISRTVCAQVPPEIVFARIKFISMHLNFGSAFRWPMLTTMRTHPPSNL